MAYQQLSRGVIREMGISSAEFPTRLWLPPLFEGGHWDEQGLPCAMAMLAWEPSLPQAAKGGTKPDPGPKGKKKQYL